MQFRFRRTSRLISKRSGYLRNMKRKVWQTLAVTSFLYFASAAPGYAEELPLPTSAEDVAAAIQDIASTVAAVPEAPPLPHGRSRRCRHRRRTPPTNARRRRKRPRKASISRPRRSISRRATDAASTPAAPASTASRRGTGRPRRRPRPPRRWSRPRPQISLARIRRRVRFLPHGSGTGIGTAIRRSVPPEQNVIVDGTWSWNWNFNCASPNAPSGSGQYQNASTQYQPQNSNISIRIGSPGDNGAVTQTIAAVAQATTATVNAIAQTACADHGVGRCGPRDGPDGHRYGGDRRPARS